MVLQDERGSGSAKWPHRRAGGSDAELRDRACVVRLASAEVCEGNDRGANHEGGDKDGCEPARPATQFERLSL